MTLTARAIRHGTAMGDMSITRKQMRKEMARKELERRQALEPKVELPSVLSISERLKDYFHHKYHPRFQELLTKYQSLLDNENIRSKLLEKYPNTRISEEEYKKQFRDMFADNPFTMFIKKPKSNNFYGRCIPIQKS